MARQGRSIALWLEGQRLSPEEAKRVITARKKELRRQISSERQILHERLGIGVGGRSGLRRRLTLLICLVIVWLALRDCECDVPPSDLGQASAPKAVPPTEPQENVSAIDVSKPAKSSLKKKSRLSRGRIEPQQRPQYKSEMPSKKRWLRTLRLQVAARSPRLAKCFVGIKAPGAIKWSATIAVDSGRVDGGRWAV